MKSSINKHRGAFIQVWLALFLAAGSFHSPASAQEQNVTATESTATEISNLRDVDLSQIEVGDDVEFVATVTYWDPRSTFVFVQDDDRALFMTRSNPGELKTGTRVSVQGTLKAGDLQNFVAAKRVNVLGEDPPLKAATVDLERLQFGEFDARLIQAEGVVKQVQVMSQVTLLFLQTSGTEEKEFRAIIRHHGIQLANASRLVGKRIRLAGCLGLFFSEADYVGQHQPGKRVIEGFQLYCDSTSSYDLLDKESDSYASPEVIDLAQLESEGFPPGPFITHGQVSLINYATEPRELVLFDQSSSMRTQVRYTDGIEPGMVLKLGGIKQRNPNGNYEYTTTYTHQLNLAALLPPNQVPFAQSIEEYEPDRRVMIQCQPKEIIRGDLLLTDYLKAGDNDGQTSETIDIRFQQSASEALAFADPAFAKTIRVTGVMSPNLSRPNSDSAYELVVSNAEHIELVQKKPELWRLAGGVLIGLVSAFALLAIWSGVLKFLVDRKTKDVQGVAAQLRYSYDAIDDGVVVIGKEGTVLAANDEFRRLTQSNIRFGGNVGDLPAHLSKRLKEPEQFKKQWDDWFTDPSLNSVYEIEILHPERANVIIHSAPVHVANDPDATNRIIMWRDETDRRRLQSEVLHNNKLKAVGRLASGVAHDFNNVLTAITGNLSVARMQPESQVADVDHELARAEDAAFRGAEQIRRLLTYSSKTEYNLRPTSINGIIMRLHELVQHMFDASISFSQELDVSEPVINVESSAIEQVILNLFVNAKDAMPGGGNIRITTRVIREINDEELVLISVEDDGIGVPDELVDRLFEPYFTTKHDHGNGIGLSVSLRVIEQHGGKLRYRKSPEGGGVFEILLPSVDAEPEAQPAKETVSVAGCGKILVVDDEDIIRDVAQTLLRNYGFDAIAADSGPMALEMLAEQASQVDVVLLDVSMPGMSGWEALSHIRERWPTMPVVLCSGYLVNNDLARDPSKAPTATIAKPYKSADLVRVISESLPSTVSDTTSNAKAALEGGQGWFAKNDACGPVATEPFER